MLEGSGIKNKPNVLNAIEALRRSESSNPLGITARHIVASHLGS